MLDSDAGEQSGAEERNIEAARRGDLAAFNWLVLRYQTRVYNLCYRMLSDPDEAADATQEAFISAYKAIGRFKGGNFRAWVLRIASNACLDFRSSIRAISRIGRWSTTQYRGCRRPTSIAPSTAMDCGRRAFATTTDISGSSIGRAIR